MILDAFKVLESELCPPTRRKAINQDVDDPAAEKTKYDREKGTAVNVAHMFHFLSEKKWLGRDHTYAEYIVNPLREHPLVIEDPCFAQKITLAETVGRTAAMMHLSLKLSELFGEIHDEDHKFFPDNADIPKQGHWTTQYNFKAMASYDPNRKVVKLGKRERRSGLEEAEKTMNRQIKRLNIARDTLKDIITRDESDVRKAAAQKTIEEVSSVEHILSDRAYAYRERQQSDNAYHRKEGLFMEFQDILIKRDLLDDTGLFASHRCFTNGAPFLSVHVDLTDEILLTPVSDLETLNIGDAVSSRLQSSIVTYLPTKDLHTVRGIHIHVDVQEEIPPHCYIDQRQKGYTARELHLMRDGLSAQKLKNSHALEREVFNQNDFPVSPVKGASKLKALNAHSRQRTPTYVGANVDTQLKDRWASIVKDGNNLGFLRSLYAVFGAEAALERVRKAKAAHRSQHEDSSLSECRVYVHGACVAISLKARTAPLDELKYTRFGDGVFVYTNTDILPPVMLTEGIEDGNVTGYGNDCCWELSRKGLSRFANGDSSHGQSLTRIVYSLMSVTKERFVNWRISEGTGSVWIASPHTEIALLTLCNRSLTKLDIFSVLDDRSAYVSSNRLKSALDRIRISPEDQILAHGMSGCTECPSTQGITKKKYPEALIESRDLIGSLFVREISENRHRRAESLVCLEHFVAVTYLSAYGSAKGPPGKPSDIFSLRSHEASNWPQMVRVWVPKSTEVLKPMMLMPEKEDIELQARRSLCLLRYWQSSDQKVCNRLSAGGRSAADGYQANGKPLIEADEQVTFRQKTMKKPVQVCACKSGCDKQRCSCEKNSGLCLIFSCNDNCRNRGTPSAPVVPVFSNREDEEDENEVDYENHTSDDDDGRYGSDAESIICQD